MQHEPPRDLLMQCQEQLLHRIESYHLRPLSDSDGSVIYISDQYPGVWMEHVFDSLAWGQYKPDQHRISDNYVRLFLKHQKPDGQLPCYVWANAIGYGHIQECVSFGRLCLETVDLNPQDTALLSDSYAALCRWDEWLCRKRMTLGTGLIEMFCGYDTGHDNSGRLFDLKYPGMFNEDGGLVPTDDPALPIITPDMNAVFYGDRVALSEMAARLGRTDESAAWAAKAEDVKKRLFDICFDEQDMFFYDVDRNGQMRRVRSISITNLFTEHIFDKSFGSDLFEKHLHNPDEFWTAYPFPAVAVNDPAWVQNLPGNSWGYYSQGLTALRTLRWMEHYGKSAEMEELMSRWVRAWCIDHPQPLPYGQELHPITGVPSKCSPYYSTCMLYLLHSLRRLYGI